MDNISQITVGGNPSPHSFYSTTQRGGTSMDKSFEN